MTNLGQLSFNTTNIDVSVVRATANSVSNGHPPCQFPSARTPDNPATIAGTVVYQNSQTVDLNQVEPSAMSPNSNPKPYSNWERILSTPLVAFNIATRGRSGLVDCPL